MLIYNVTTKVDWSIADEWEQWMKEVHIPQIIETGCFVKYQFARLLETDEEEGPTFTAQYFANSRSSYDTYINEFAPAFREMIINKWGNKFIAFRSLMQLLD
jgi:hypothetical protein